MCLLWSLASVCIVSPSRLLQITDSHSARTFSPLHHEAITDLMRRVPVTANSVTAFIPNDRNA